MAADFRLVSHTAERHAHEGTVGRARDALAQRGLPDARRTDEAQHRTLGLAHALLHREVFEDAFLHLFEPVVVLLQDLLGAPEIVAHLAALLPRYVHHPVEIAAHYGSFRRHRRHHLQFVELCERLGLRLLRHACATDAPLEALDLARRILELAELLLDGLHLLIQIVLALALLHLLLDATADALLDLEQLDLAFHQAHEVLDARDGRVHLEDLLLLREFQRHVRGNGVG